MSYFEAIFRYIEEGVRNSADNVAHIGTRFGGSGDFEANFMTSRTVSMVGWTAILKWNKHVGRNLGKSMYFGRHVGPGRESQRGVRALVVEREDRTYFR
jgi:hypothetical protein